VLNFASYTSNRPSVISMNAVVCHSSISVTILLSATVTDVLSENLLRFWHWSHAVPKNQSQEDIDYRIKYTSMSRLRIFHRELLFNFSFSGHLKQDHITFHSSVQKAEMTSMLYFVNFNFFDTRWQYYSTQLHTNSTEYKNPLIFYISYGKSQPGEQHFWVFFSDPALKPHQIYWKF
jgi:hypothetical protein